ncbi:MAG TPA: transketolase C-terminal domain-containing protein [Anaerolineae bacterium]|nr:transketolase C-terminal domain-containing protein [Anaerolineae bacterium]
MRLGERAGLQPAERLREVFGDAILDLCRQNEKVVVLDGDLSSTTRTHAVREEFPDRFFNVGIAESNMISMGAGMASCDLIPFMTSLSSFILANGFDQLRVSVAVAGLNAKVVGSHGGITLGKDGATAMSIEDLALVGCLPTFVILVPCDPASMHKAVHAAAEHVGPVYLRSSRVAMPHIYPMDDCPFQIGKANVVRQGGDLTIIGCGLMVAAALDAAVLLSEEGIEARVLDMHTLRPLDQEAIAAAARETGGIVTAEEHLLHGGMGSNIARIVGQTHPVPMGFVGLADTYTDSGEPDDLLEKYGLTAGDIVAAAQEVVRVKRKT